ncbi:DUF6777 domain-containing protein [Streptomyces sp. NPDC006512]|uniref:DUF6777 domain-containing protein n=1 Tax=Streptomyces sp. NPDC006512 TaxID=3154307 RepID=UPI00339F2944
MKDVNDVPAPMTSRQASRRHVPTCTALFALVGLLAAGCTGSAPEETKGPPAESKEVLLQPVGAAGSTPFTASFATRESAPVQPPLPNPSGRGIRTVNAATPGLYGGTQRFGSCDVERQVGFLAGDEAKARAFAQVSGVEQAKLPEFLRGLTPVVLRADTRVTSHGYRDGRPEDFQAVLQAGTAVLVDAHGMPRVRCGCGNPLVAPRAASGSPVTKGDPWPGYQANQVIVIEPTPRALDNLVIVNVADNTWIERRTGDDGAQDKTPRVLPAYDPSDGIPDGPATPPGTSASDPCTAADPHSLDRTSPPVSPSVPPAGPPSDVPSDVTGGVPGGVPGEVPADPGADAPLDPATGVPLDVPTDLTGEFPTDPTADVPLDLSPDAPLDTALDVPLDLPLDVPADVPGAPGAPGVADLPGSPGPHTELPADGSSGVPGGVPADPGASSGLPLAGPQSAVPGAGTPAPCPPGADALPGRPPQQPADPQQPANPQTPPSGRPADPAPNPRSDAPADVPSDLPPQAPNDPALPQDPEDAPWLEDLLDPYLPEGPNTSPDLLTEPSEETGYLESA